MKKNLVKKCIGLIVSMAMMAGLMFVSGAVEAKAADWPGEPEAGDEIILGDGNKYTDVTLKTVELTVEGSAYKFYYVFDDTHAGGSPDFYCDLKWNNSESCWSCRGNYTSFDDFKNGVVSGGRENIDGMVKYVQCAYYKLYDLPTPDPAPTPGHNHNWSWGTITEPTEYSDGMEGYICTICGATKDTVTISSTGVFMENKYNQVKNAKAGETVVLEMGPWHSLSKGFMEEIAKRRDVTFVIHFIYEGKKYEVVIPAGRPLVLDPSIDWYGPLKQNEMFGMKEIM